MDSKELLAVNGLAVETDRDRFLSTLDFDPSYGEYLRAKVGQGYDFTTTRLVREEAAITSAEMDAYGYHNVALRNEEYAPSWGQQGGRTLRDAVSGRDPDEIKAPVTLTAEEYKQSEHYREGVKWRDGWTEVRARVMAEQYDMRRYREEIIARADVGPVGAVVGFGASMLGSLPDPINLIPFGQGFSRAALGSKLLAGAAEGFFGNLAVNAIVYPDLIARGEELGFMDFMADLAAGTVLGTGLAGTGHAFSKGLNALASRRADDFNKVIKATSEDMGVEIAEFKSSGLIAADDIKPVMKLTGTEMSEAVDAKTPETSAQIRKAAINYYKKNLQEATVVNSTLGEVRFSNKGIRKVISSSANLDKLRFIPAIKDIIEKGRYLGAETPNKVRDDGIIKFHRVGEYVEMDNHAKFVSVLIGEDSKGNLFYNFNPETKPSTDSRGPASLNESSSSSLKPVEVQGRESTPGYRNIPENNITQTSENVNIEVTDAKTAADKIAVDNANLDKLHVRQTLHGKDKAAVYKGIDKAVADMADGQRVDVKAVYEQSPAYQKLSRERQLSLFPDEIKPQKTEPPDPSVGDKTAEAYGLEALDDFDRLRDLGLLDETEAIAMEKADANIKKAQSVKGAVRNMIGCMFGI